MIEEAIVKELASEKALELGGFLVSTKVSGQNIINVFVDKKVGISINECLQISRHIENKLDREIEDFQLSVSSPGLNKPFLVKEQYHKNIGKDIVVKLKNGEKVKGKLIDYNNNITIETTSKIKGKQDKVINKFIIASEEIKETKLIFKI
jgi:ribosome maturation factor RimP|tara:strand:- start:21387 stop:21836 length:450 start_codon:yes stop_codon:yes gene_type:complete